jgi:hypothetical protein
LAPNDAVGGSRKSDAPKGIIWVKKVNRRVGFATIVSSNLNSKQ